MLTNVQQVSDYGDGIYMWYECRGQNLNFFAFGRFSFKEFSFIIYIFNHFFLLDCGRLSIIAIKNHSNTY